MQRVVQAREAGIKIGTPGSLDVYAVHHFSDVCCKSCKRQPLVERQTAFMLLQFSLMIIEQIQLLKFVGLTGRKHMQWVCSAETRLWSSAGLL